ncbi:MAG: hypothetical protein L0226_06175 [Acidobacteria bacterium]|nr:hypothetical protein [Acidobacteriota bacterium]
MENEIPTNEEMMAMPVERQIEVLALVVELHQRDPEAAKAMGYKLVNDYEIAESDAVLITKLAE